MQDLHVPERSGFPRVAAASECGRPINQGTHGRPSLRERGRQSDGTAAISERDQPEMVAGSGRTESKFTMRLGTGKARLNLTPEDPPACLPPAASRWRRYSTLHREEKCSARNRQRDACGGAVQGSITGILRLPKRPGHSGEIGLALRGRLDLCGIGWRGGKLRDGFRALLGYPRRRRVG